MKRTAKVALILLLSASLAWAVGTALSITFGTATVTCTTTGGSVSIPYTVSTTAADAANVTETLTSTNAVGFTTRQTGYAIAAGNVTDGGGWTFAGRTKTKDSTYATSSLPNGDYSLEVCATQAGSGGNPDKTVCSTKTFTVNCTSSSVCANTEFEGEVTGSSNLCRTDNANFEVQFTGDFGNIASLTITRIDSENSSNNVIVLNNAAVDDAGESCHYHYNWNPSASDKQAGTYKFEVTGNGNTKSITKDFVCTTN